MVSKATKKMFSNKNLVNVLYLVMLVLSVMYVNNKQYTALLYLYLIAGVVFMFTKNVLYALGISIIVTNLLVSYKYIEGMSVPGHHGGSIQDAANQRNQRTAENNSTSDGLPNLLGGMMQHMGMGSNTETTGGESSGPPNMSGSNGD